MIKTIPILIALLGFFASIRAQALLDKMSKEACDCLEKKKLDTKESEEFTMQLGFCILETTTDRKKEIKKEIGVDIDEEGGFEKLGERLGANMAFNCPLFLNYVQQEMSKPNSELRDKVMDELEGEGQLFSNSESGQCTEIRRQQFVSVMIKNEAGKTAEYFWFEFFPGSNLLEGKDVDLIGKSFKFEFVEKEMFLPSQSQYFKLKILTRLEAI